MKIALIPPIAKSDYLVNTVIDGLICLKNEKHDIDFCMPNYHYPCPYDIESYKKSESDFLSFAHTADLIIFCWGKGATNYALAKKINRFNVTVFVDGSELGKDRRFDQDIRKQVEDMVYEGGGAIDRDMLARSALYFRREKPYIHGIIPLPFGIESRYLAEYKSNIKKDIDFSCIFGQEDYPVLRREVREYTEKACKINDLNCATKKTNGFSFDDDKKIAGRNQFYEILTRSKVGISIGGGGYDTARFWEILGNNCLLLTENIDIFEKESPALGYSRIFQFSNINEFQMQFEKLTEFIKTKYNQDALKEEYQTILNEHSSKSRVMTILNSAKEKGIIQ
jgi:hypothetical protein